jgi:hypothetical protein
MEWENVKNPLQFKLIYDCFFEDHELQGQTCVYPILQCSTSAKRIILGLKFTTPSFALTMAVASSPLQE